MNKLEKYCLHSALQTSSSLEIQDAFYPIGSSRYISFNTNKSSGYQYPHWNELVKLLKPHLDKENISIYRIGDCSGFTIDSVKNFSGCTFNQNAFIIKNSLLHFNILDEFSLASYQFDTPCISFSPNFDESFFPFQSKKSFSILTPQHKKFPTLVNDYQGLVALLNPESFAEHILTKLNISHSLNDFSMVYSGSMAHIPTVEVVPDFIPNQDFLAGSTVNIRNDLHHDESNLIAWAKGRKLGIVTSEPISTNCLYHLRPNLVKLSVNADSGIDENFLNSIKALNIKYDIYCTNSDKLTSLRLNFIDEVIEHFPLTEKKDLDLPSDICDNGIIRSSKVLLSKGKKFSSKAHWIVGSEQTENFSTIIDTKDFWCDSEFLYIYQKNDKTKD